IPGIAMALLLLVLLGGMQWRPRVASGSAARPKRSFSDVLRDFRTLLQNRVLIFLCASSVFRSMTHGGLMTFLPIYLARELGYSTFMIGAAMAALQTAGFIASPISGHLSDKMGRRQIIMSWGRVAAVIFAFLIVGGGSCAFVFFFPFLVFFFFRLRAGLQAWPLDSPPANMGGSAIGVLFAIQSLGSSIGPLACGAIADSYGLLATFYFLVATIIVANMFIFFTPTPAEESRYAQAPAE